MTRRPRAGRLRAPWWRLCWPLLLLLLYLLIEQLWIATSADGLFLAAVTGEGLGAAGLGLVVVTLRPLTLVLVPALLVRALVLALWERWRRRAPAAAAHRPSP